MRPHPLMQRTVVIPSNNLVEIIVKMNAGRTVNNRTARVMNEVLGHHSQLSVS